MTETQKPSVVLSIFAAMVALPGVVLGFGFFVAIANEVSQAWNEGGSGMYLVLLGSLTATLAGAAAAFFATRGQPMAWGLSAALLVGTFAAGVASYRLAMSESFEAIQHAAPADRAIIMNGAAGEASWTLVFAALMVAGLLLCQGAALAFGSIGAREPSHRRGLVILGLGVMVLGVWQGLSGLAMHSERGAYAAVAFASPADRMTILFSEFEQAASFSRAATLSLGAVALVCLLAVALLRATPRLLVGVVAGLAVTTAGLGGMRVLGRPSAEQRVLLTTSRVPRPLMELDAVSVDVPYPFITQGSELRDVNNKPMPMEELDLKFRGRSGGFELGLEPGVTVQSLAKTLSAVRARGVSSVLLVGTMRSSIPEGMSVPPAFEPYLTETRGVRVLLGRRGVECPETGCKWAKLDAAGLTFGGETWPLLTKSSEWLGGAVNFEESVPLDLEGLELQQFLSAAHTAADKHKLLAVFF